MGLEVLERAAPPAVDRAAIVVPPFSLDMAPAIVGGRITHPIPRLFSTVFSTWEKPVTTSATKIITHTDGALLHTMQSLLDLRRIRPRIGQPTGRRDVVNDAVETVKPKNWGEDLGIVVTGPDGSELYYDYQNLPTGEQVSITDGSRRIVVDSMEGRMRIHLARNNPPELSFLGRVDINER